MNLGQLESAILNRANRYIHGLSGRRWRDNPLTAAPIASPADYTRLWEETRNRAWPDIDALEQSLGHSLDKQWMDDLALKTQICIKDSELCYQHGRVLYAVLADLLTKRRDTNLPLSILETGTARGFSALCMARALSDHQNNGRILTYDLLPHRKPIYWNVIDDHDGKKSREELLAPWKDLMRQHIVFVEGDTRITLDSVHLDHIDFAFLDGGHTYEHVTWEFDLVQQRQQQGDVIVFDDYTPGSFDGLVKAVDDGCIRFGYDKQVVTAHQNRGYVIATRQ